MGDIVLVEQYFCGLLFSGIAHAVNIADVPPTSDVFRALQVPPGTVLTHERYGFWVEMAGHTAVLDPLWGELSDPQIQQWDVQTLYASTDLEDTKILLDKYNVTHVMI